jgi:hypothetical protein
MITPFTIEAHDHTPFDPHSRMHELAHHSFLTSLVKESPITSIIEESYLKYDSDLRHISLEIHNYRELAFCEHKSARRLMGFLARQGLVVERGIAGDETAFVGTWGWDTADRFLDDDIEVLIVGIRRPSRHRPCLWHN